MLAALRLFLACAPLFSAVSAHAQGPNPLNAVRADRWAEAQAVVAGIIDPVPLKLVRYYRALATGGANAAEIAEFVRLSPDWPAQAQLERRRQEALVTEPDSALVTAQCAVTRPTQAPTLLRCAEITNDASFARDAWVAGIQADAAFLRRWGQALTADDEWARYQRLSWSNTQAADQQAPRVDATRRALPVAAQVLARAKSLRSAGDLSAARSLWLREVPAAQQASPPDRLALFWSERAALVRALLKQGDNQGAYALVKVHGQTAGEAVTDAEFLSGFIALRRLNQPGVALKHFQALAAASPAAITQGRAHYWQARALVAMGRDPKPEYEQAAAWATTFYGQLAAVALGDDAARLNKRINGLRDPAWNRDTAQAFTGHEVARAAAWLVAWGDPVRARAFLLRMDEIAPNTGERVLTAELALKLGMPDMAVFIARRMGRDGIALPRAGWPQPFTPPPVLDQAASLGIMRQESSFDIRAVSSSGALGLMQLMPFTARDVAKKLGVPVGLGTLTTDPAHNMTLGTAYLKDVLDRFGGSLPLAAAGYNAGPHRVDQWLVEYGDPRTDAIAMLDWLELIPFNETRNYVQRVMENTAIYRARSGSVEPVYQARWAR